MRLTSANLSWRGQQPWAADFDDIYCSADGVAETERVFIGPGNIAAMADAQRQICVAELGFGSALNFAVCARQVLNRSAARLHYVGFEKHPLRQADWQTVCAQRNSELPLYGELRGQPLPVMAGWHQRTLARGRITLSVFHGEVAEGLRDLLARQANPVDAWFLDGFAPRKNPSMWTPEIYQHLARMARPGTTVSTFTAAGHVRRGLQAAGFGMRKVDQRPFKRESLAGAYLGDSKRVQRSPPPLATVHGAGVGGACVARHLAEQQTAVRVYDPNGIAAGASRIDAAVMHSRLLGDHSADADLRASAFHYAANYVERFAGFARSGVLQVQGANLDAHKLDRLSDAYDATHDDQNFWIKRLDHSAAAAVSATRVGGDALLFPTAGVVQLPALCASLLDHPLIEVVARAAEFDAADCNIICTGAAARSHWAWLEIAEVQGQVDWFAAPGLARLPVIGSGYLIPTHEGCALGATYEHKPWSAADATAHNLGVAAHYFEQAGLRDPAQLWRRRSRGARAVTSDRIPVIGRLPLREDDRNTWIATAFGSMGTTLAPLAAAMVSSELLGWLPPVAPAVQTATRPQRFKERQARRGVRHVQPLA